MTATISDPLKLPCGAVIRNRIAKSAMTEGLRKSITRKTTTK